MKKIILLSLFISLPLCGTNKNLYNDLIQQKAPKELGEIHIIEKKDITDENNLEAFNKYNPEIIIKDDFNKNGKEDLVLPCVSQSKSNWYVLVFEKNNGEYNFVQYFKFNFKSIYIFKVKGKNGYVITLGESFASDVYYNIFWDGKKYIKD
jgi:hypothetical protein